VVMHKVIRSLCVVLGGMVIGFTIMAVMAVGSGYRFNPTSSAPVGIWKISSEKPHKLNVGEYVLICPPVHEVLNSLIKQGRMFKGRCDSGTVPFIKEVVAHSKGTFRVEDDGVYIDDEVIPKTAPYPWEHLIPAPPSEINSDEFVAIQTLHVGSIDSRYFGPLPVDDVIGVIEPIWTY